MGSYRSSKVARRLVTVSVLLTVLVTTFLPGWDSPAQAAPAARGAVTIPASNTVVTAAGGSASRSVSARPPASQIPLNALVLSEPGKVDALAAAIVNQGGTLYVHEGDALFVGLDELGYAELASLGARAVYQSTVTASELTRLSSPDRDAVAAWNQIAGAPPSSPATIAAGGGAASQAFLSVASPQARPAPGLNEPSETQTSIFMAGDVAVKVVFVESISGPENWTENEIAKVKTEVVQALDWWTTTATAPESLGGDPRPPANLTWDVSYVSPFEGSDLDRTRIRLATEPIEHGIWYGIDAGGLGGWMTQVAAAFTGLYADETAIREFANITRNDAGDDWGFVLYVVDSSSDSDGKFSDGKAAGAALNGPWAVVSYSGGTLGVDNLEILIAKMIGHVFGAGDESYNPAFPDQGCRNDEYYGYLRISHANCEWGKSNPDPSLMLSNQRMVDAYQGHQLSTSARAQIGWRDSDSNGIYDVLDTLSDTYDNPSGQALCPILHLLDIPIANIPTLPDEIGGTDTYDLWHGVVWDPVTRNLVPGPEFTPVNINRPGFVWGRVNEGEWVAGEPADGEWDSLDESYNLRLPATAGELNRVEIAIMNRWEQQAYVSTNPVSVTVLDPIDAGGPYESNDTDSTELYLTSTSGWTKSDDDPSYSGGNTETSNGTKAEACFAFNGTEVSILHSMLTDGSANVYVDGELHSTITYEDLGFTQSNGIKHTIADLAPGNHTVTIEATEGVIDFDAWAITNTVSSQVIDAWGDPGLTSDGYYEALSTPNKIQYVGAWAEVPLSAPGRAGTTTPDGLGMSSVSDYDRVYAYFTHADTVAIYRGVFPDGGSADVYVDGSLRGTMYNNAKVAGVMPFYIGGLDPNADHTVEVSINPDAPRFDLDALRFLYLSDKTSPDLYIADTPGVSLDVPYTGAQERYGKWVPYPAYRFMLTNEEGALQTLFFQGSAVAVQVATGTANGLLEIYVDGRLERTVDNKAPASADMPIVAHGFDPTLPHVLQVRHINANPLYPKANKIYGFTVYSVPPVSPDTPGSPGNPPGSYEEYEYDVKNKPVRSDFIYEEKWAFSPVITAATGPSGRRYMVSAHPNARAYLYFTGADSLTIYGVSGTFGAADIYINGELKGTFIEKGVFGYNRPYTVTGLDPGRTNCLELRISMKPGLVRKITLDRVVLYNRPVLTPDTLEEGGTLPGHFENDAMIDIGGGQLAPALQFSGLWKRLSNTRASGGTFDMVGSINDEVVFNVRNATSVVLYRRLFYAYGQAEVYVDGKLRNTFDNYVYAPLIGVYQQKYVIAGLDPGFDHQIRIVPKRLGKALNVYKPFDVDYIEVRTGDLSTVNYLENGYYENNDGGAVGGGAISYVGSSWITGDVSTAKVKGDKAVVVFFGNAFSVYFNKNNTGGRAAIYIDGVLKGTYLQYSAKPIPDVPFSVAGLENGMHVAEIVAQTAKTNIDAYRVYSAEPNTAPTTYTMSPIDSRLILSGYWTVSGSYLTTREANARLYLYVSGGDTLVVTHQKITLNTGTIRVSVNGTLHSTIDPYTIRTVVGTDGNYVVSGLHGMLTRGYWIEITDPTAQPIALKQLKVDRVENVVNPVTDNGNKVEAEGTAAAPVGTENSNVIPAGFWWKRPGTPNAAYSEKFYYQSRNKFVHYYIPTQNVSYLTIYRPLGPGFGDATVYLDGEFWGTMPNKAPVLRPPVPFSVGPIPEPSNVHVVELRQAGAYTFALDKFVGVGMQTIGPGFYENDHPAFVGGDDLVSGKHYFNAYTGTWRKINDAKASGGTLHQSKVTGNRLSAVFEGNEIVIYRRTTVYGAFMTAFVDGVPYPINNKSATAVNGVTHTILLSNNGPHSLELYGNAGQLDFDAIEIKTAVPATKGAYQHDSPYVVLNGPWTTVTSDKHSEDAHVTTNLKYASAFFLFSGDRVTTYLTRGRNWGIVNVYLDGILVGRVDLYLYNLKLHPIDEPFFEYDLPNLEGGTHVLELRFEGKRNLLGKPIVNFDAFTVNGYPVPRPGEYMEPTAGGGGGGGPVVLPEVGCYEENSSWWKFVGPSDWSWFGVQAIGQASGGQYKRGRSNNAGDVYAEFAFKGTSFGLVYHKRAQGGIAEVYVDGVLMDNLDMYSADDVWITTDPYAVLYPVEGLPDGNHVVRVVFKHDKNPSSTGYDIYIDRIDLPVYSTEPSCSIKIPAP
jgi:hypothetical protein